MFREKIQKAIQKATWLETVQVDVPGQESFGDYASSIAMAMFSNDQFSIFNFRSNSNIKNPRELAEKLAEELQEDKDLMEIVEKIEIAGPGFLNFWIKKSALREEMEEILGKLGRYGRGKDQHRKVVVEYSSPNIAKPFTIGHLRSTIIGDAIANLLEATGWTVYRDNHLGDWGTQFGKQIYAIKAWGDEDAIEKSDNPVDELVKLYVKFHEESEKDPGIEDNGREWFKKLEDGDLEAKRLWNKCIEWSFREFKRIYSVLGITFTENEGKGYGESFVEDRMKPVVQELQDKNLLKEGKEGARLVFFPDEKYPPLMILKKDGSSLYSTRDLAMDKWRLVHYGNDLTVINEVGMEQSLYFQQLYEVESMLEWYKEGQRVHIKHGHFRFADKKMSTRKGNVIWLNDVLNEAITRARELAMKSGEKEKDIETLAKQVAVGALKWNELKRDPIKDIVFHWDEILNMEGNSGPYMQYTYARAQSVLRRAEFPISNFQFPINEAVQQFNNEEMSVLRMLPRFGEAVEDAAGAYSPNLLANYLYELASKFNTFYNKHRILEADGESRDFRLALTSATATVLQNGLHLLGIETPEKM